MPQFSFQARDIDDLPQSGEIEAADPRAAREQLVLYGWKVLSLKPVEPDVALAAPKSLSANDAVELTAQIAELASASIPLSSGLRALSMDMPRGQLRKTVGRLAAHLESGVPLDRAATMPDVRLPPYLCGLLACGLRSGQLALVLEQFLGHERLRDDLTRRMWAALAYPLLLVALLAAWILFVFQVLLKGFEQIYADFEVELPPLTVTMFSSAKYVPGLAVATILSVVVLIVLIRWFGRSRWICDLLAAIPLIGPYLRERGMFEFTSLLALLVEYSAPLPQALKLTATGVSDGSLAAGARQSAKFAESGMGLTESLCRVAVFPSSIRPILAWGERVSSPQEALASVAEWFRLRCDLRSDLLTVVIPPLTFTFVTFAMTTLAVALLLPFVKLIESLT